MISPPSLVSSREEKELLKFPADSCVRCFLLYLYIYIYQTTIPDSSSRAVASDLPVKSIDCDGSELPQLQTADSVASLLWNDSATNS